MAARGDHLSAATAAALGQAQFLLLAAALALQGGGAFEISLDPGVNLSVLIKPVLPWCPLCSGTTCYTDKKIYPGERFTFTFGCPSPEKHWVLMIEKHVDCMQGPCPFGDVHLRPLGLPPLNKTFIWNVKVNRKFGLDLKFSTPWLKQIIPGDTCPDGALYKIDSRLDNSLVNIGHFCRNGTVSGVKVQGEVIMNLQLPWDSKLTTSGFKIESRSSIKRLCIIEATFQGKSSASFISANYPLGFPEDELMTWQFVIPANLRAYVSFLNHTKANCERKEQIVEYQWPGSADDVAIRHSLDSAQPANIPGSFNLSLQGCDQDDVTPGRLHLRFAVVVQYPSNEPNATYDIDLRSEKNMNVTIYSKPSHSGFPEQLCLICKTPKICLSNMTLTSGTKYSIMFMCSTMDNLRIIATKSIVCWNERACQSNPFALEVPKSLIYLPIYLESVTWKFVAPENINIEIRSPTLKLQQHIPEQNQKCSGGFSYIVNSTTPGKALNLGILCPGGVIEKIQMRDNVSLTLKTYGRKYINETITKNLQMSFVPTTKEECIFTVTADPNSKKPIYLQTPNWIDGLPPYVSVNWNINIPTKQVAQLTFLKKQMGISCEKGHAYVYVMEQSPKAVKTVCRDDQSLPETLTMNRPFWLNITNCKPDAKQLLILQFKVTLQQKSDLPIIIGAVAGGIAMIGAIGLLVCCTKKKNTKKETPIAMVGVYDGHVNTQVPGRRGLFKKERESSETHVYAIIDDSSVYGHLLDKPRVPEPAEVGVYRPFTGPMSTSPPSPPPISSVRKKSKVSTLEESSLVPMTDNGTYTHCMLDELKGNSDAKMSGEVGTSLLDSQDQGNTVE